MQKVVLSLEVHDDKKCRQKVMQITSSVEGVDQISLDMEKNKLTIIGSMDPVEMVGKLRKVYHATVDSIGPATEPEKPKKEVPKTEEAKVQTQASMVWEPSYHYQYPLYPGYYYFYNHES